MIRMAAITAAGRYGMELKFRSGRFFLRAGYARLSDRGDICGRADRRRRDEERKEE